MTCFWGLGRHNFFFFGLVAWQSALSSHTVSFDGEYHANQLALLSPWNPPHSIETIHDAKPSCCLFQDLCHLSGWVMVGWQQGYRCQICFHCSCVLNSSHVLFRLPLARYGVTAQGAVIILRGPRSLSNSRHCRNSIAQALACPGLPTLHYKYTYRAC